MDNNKNNSGNNFFSGFLLGVLVGAACVFLFGTKKGKRLLKAISEEGAENISNILEKVDKSLDTDEIMEDDDEPYTPRESTPVKSPLSSKRTPSFDSVRQASSVSSKASAPKVRRFFKGISRRVN